MPNHAFLTNSTNIIYDYQQSTARKNSNSIAQPPIFPPLTLPPARATQAENPGNR